MAQREKMQKQIEGMKPWFHNIHLPDGSQTAPAHNLGDFPAYKWEEIKHLIPEDLSGKTVLDIGCNAGFYSIEMARRNAHVTAIDIDDHYLKQARWVAAQFGLQKQITFHRMQVYDLAKTDWQFDIVLFLGVFYHLRYPLLAMDILSEKIGTHLVFQSLSLLQKKEHASISDFSFNKRRLLESHGWPSMAFIEQSFSGDPTNWWVPNAAAIKAICRSCGLEFIEKAGKETYFFERMQERIPVAQSWNRSEYLSAIGCDWSNEVAKKTAQKK